MPNPNELRLIRAALDLKQAPMAKALGINSQSYYSSLEADPDKPAAQEVLEKARALYLEKTGHAWPGTMRDLVRDIGSAGLPAKEVPAGTIGGSGWSQSPEERHRAEAVRRELVKRGMEERPIPSLDGPTLHQAAQILDEELFKGRPWREDLRWELIAQIGRQVVEAKREGFQGADLEKEIRRRIHAWIRAAHDLGTPE